MDCADYRIHSDCTADSTGYNLLYGLSPDSVTISPCKSIMLSRGFWFQALGDWYLSHSKITRCNIFLA